MSEGVRGNVPIDSSQFRILLNEISNGLCGKLCGVLGKEDVLVFNPIFLYQFHIILQRFENTVIRQKDMALFVSFSHDAKRSIF